MRLKMPHISIIPLLVSAGVLLYCAISQLMTLSQNSKVLAPFYEHSVKLSGVLVDSADKKDGKIKIHIKDISINNGIKIYDSQVYAVLKDAKVELERSDRITIAGKMDAGFGRYVGYFYEPKLIAHNKPDPPDFALKIRAKITKELKKYLDPEEAGLALGYLFGDKASMSASLIEQIRLAGLSHLVVTSGFHLSILISVARRLFGKISRIAVLFGVFFSALLFISISGASASMMRAGLMSLLATFAWFFGRKFHPGRLLLYVAAITTIISPDIILDVGWQLSFASFSGIVFLVPLLTKFLYDDGTPNIIASGLIVSFAAQLFCLPISIYYFGMFSIVGIVAGLIISPTIAFLLLMLCFGALSSTMTIPLLTNIITTIASLVTSIHLAIISFASSIPWATINIPSNDARIFLLYLPIFCVVFLLKMRTKYDFRPRYQLEKIPDYGKISAC